MAKGFGNNAELNKCSVLHKKKNGSSGNKVKAGLTFDLSSNTCRSMFLVDYYLISTAYLLTTETKDEIVVAIITFQSCKILSVSIINHVFLASEKPLNSCLCYSNWTSWIEFHVSLVPEAKSPHQRSPKQCFYTWMILVWTPASKFAINQITRNQLAYSESGTPEGLGPWHSLLCLVGNPALVCPQGEVGLPGPPGLDGEKVQLSYP